MIRVMIYFFYINYSCIYCFLFIVQPASCHILVVSKLFKKVMLPYKAAYRLQSIGKYFTQFEALERAKILRTFKLDLLICRCSIQILMHEYIQLHQCDCDELCEIHKVLNYRNW